MRFRLADTNKTSPVYLISSSALVCPDSHATAQAFLHDMMVDVGEKIERLDSNVLQELVEIGLSGHAIDLNL